MSKLTRNQIEAVLQECLERMAPEKYPTEWRPGDNVIFRCGLDSQHGVDLACDLEDKLGIEIPDKDNPLIEDDDGKGRKRGRTYSEVVGYLEMLAS